MQSLIADLDTRERGTIAESMEKRGEIPTGKKSAAERSFANSASKDSIRRDPGVVDLGLLY